AKADAGIVKTVRASGHGPAGGPGGFRARPSSTLQGGRTKSRSVFLAAPVPQELANDEEAASREAGVTAHSPFVWIGFTVLVAALLVVDLFVLNRRSHVLSVKEASAWSAG